MLRTMRNVRWTGLLAMCALLAACSGGGGGGSTSGAESVSAISGTAAAGTALSGATITVSCQDVNPVQTIAATDGSYSVTLPAGAKAPCLLSATSTDTTGATTTFYSAVASGASGTATANISPITQLVVANAIGSVPSGATSLAAVASSLSSANIATSTASVVTGLSSALGVNSAALASPLTGALTAALPDSGVPPSAQDGAIDQVMSALNIGSTTMDTLSAAVSNRAASVLASVSGVATQAGLPTSAAAGCPFAASGVYATANVGASNLRNGVPNFGFVKLDFSAMTAVDGSGQAFTVTQPNANNPCQFLVQSGARSINFQVSRSGFIVATGCAPPDAAATSPTLAVACTDNPLPGCSTFSLGFPVQSGVTLADGVGNWQSVEWNLNQYTWGGSVPCQGAKLPASICALYVSFFRQFTVSAPLSGVAAMNVYDCDGLYQMGNSASLCNSSPENAQPLTMVMCSVNNDCPTTQAMGQTGVGNITINSVMDVMVNGVVNARALVFRAPNNDLIGFFVAAQGGPYAGDAAHSGNFGNHLFQEQFGVFYRPASAALSPPVGTVVRNPQWQMVDYNTGIVSATISGTTLSAVNIGTSLNPLAAGQVLSGNSALVGGTTILSVNGDSTYTLGCKDANGNALVDCRRVPGNGSSFGSIQATSQQVKEDTQVYTIGAGAGGGSLSRTFSDYLDQGLVDQVQLDTPYQGMAYRAYVAPSGSVTKANDSVSVRGSGWSVSAGTATVAQQVGGLTVNGTSYATGCTMPGQVFTPPSTCSGLSKTGKFFTVNLKY